MLVSIQEIGLTEVKYKKYNDLYGITYGMLKAEVRRIRYESGRIENFVDGKMVADKPLLSPEEKCACGRLDAEKYHGMKVGAFVCGAYCGPIAILGTSLFRQAPYMGMRTAKFSEHKDLFDDPYYLRCYNKKAKADLMRIELQGLIAIIVVPVVLVMLLQR